MRAICSVNVREDPFVPPICQGVRENRHHGVIRPSGRVQLLELYLTAQSPPSLSISQVIDVAVPHVRHFLDTDGLVARRRQKVRTNTLGPAGAGGRDR
jgi:hypothetical protein